MQLLALPNLTIAATAVTLAASCLCVGGCEVKRYSQPDADAVIDSAETPGDTEVWAGEELSEGCPPELPVTGAPCDTAEVRMCDEVCCCGFCYPTTAAICMNGAWDTITVDPCANFDCETLCSLVPVSAPGDCWSAAKACALAGQQLLDRASDMQDCLVDGDCVARPFESACGTLCGIAVASEHEEALAAFSQAVGVLYCDFGQLARTPVCSDPNAPPCEPGPPLCVQGKCEVSDR